jgi:glycosyltransferase involved in cell wall biosynthesis
MKINLDPKIIVLPSFYPMDYHYTRGGFFEEQTKLIKKAGADVAVVFNEDRSLKSFSIAKFRHIHFQKQFRIEKDDIPVLRRLNWNIIPTKYELGRKLWIKNYITLIEYYIKKYGMPDLFHVHCAFNAGSVAKYFKEKYNIPYILTEHSTFFALSDISENKKREVFNIYENAEKVIVVSKPFRILLSEKTGFPLSKIDVIPNFIDTDFFNPNLEDKTKTVQNSIFTVCHHVYKKRLDRLLDAFLIVSKYYPNWKLIIGGDGKETDFLKKKTNELELNDNVVFVGFLEKEQVKLHMMKAGLFVLPSDVETFGVVLIEALAMGLPIVATKSGGPEDIITRQTGVLVKKDPESLAYGIIKIISSYDKYDKDFIRSYAVKNYSGKVIALEYLKIYRQLS